MPDSTDARVAVYIDFDNVVISRYDNVLGDGAWRKDNARDHSALDPASDDPVDVKLAEAEVDIGAIIDYASSFGTVALTRAYADWSVPANAAYKKHAGRPGRRPGPAVLHVGHQERRRHPARRSTPSTTCSGTPTSPTSSLVAGDSDYVPLAQRCKRLGRFVVGIGVAGSTSRALVAACDEFSDYDDLPGVTPSPQAAPRAGPQEGPGEEVGQPTPRRRPPKKTAPSADRAGPQAEATALLVRAVRVGLQKSDDEWLYAGGVKSQMQRMNSGFKEKSLGYASFRDFVESRDKVVETQLAGNGQLQVRLKA